tara:strand:+ start:450 stop:716 length:267 start_codon:yes stop_codon:yes gene_type:complete
MKIFIYKTLIISFVFLIVFEITIGSKVNSFKNQINDLKSKENIQSFKKKMFEELKEGANKENYFTNEEREVLSKFINKILSELKIQQK